MAWAKLDTTTLGSTNSNITSSTFTAKTFLQLLTNNFRNGTLNTDGKIRYNSDTGTNYASRSSSNGGADATSVSQSGASYNADNASTDENLDVFYVINISSQEKLAIGFRCNKGGVGAGNPPNRREWTHKWANTSNQITTVTFNTGGSDVFAVDSNLTTLGTD